MTTTITLERDAGWGPRITVTVADTPEADAAATAFFKRVCAYTVGQPYHTASVEGFDVLGEGLANYFFPVCEHGMSALLCYGPDHYPRDDQM